MELLNRRLSELESRIATGNPIAVVVRSGKSGSFIAGAVLQEIGAISDPEVGRSKSAKGQRILRRLDRLTVPTIAAINGTCLGGGTELALCCKWRVGSDRPQTKIGLPEVRLGFIPGFGGSVRLPRLIGIRRALNMILTGKAISSKQALGWGLLDRVFRADSFEVEVRAFVMRVVRREETRAPRRLAFRDRLLEDTRLGRRTIFKGARKQVLKKLKGRYPAPVEAISVVEQTLDLQIDEALAIEAEVAGRMIVTDVSKNLIRLFLLRQGAKKALSPELIFQARNVSKTAVLGAGVMGGGVAELIAAHDVPVILKDIDDDALAVGLQHARELLDKAGEAKVFTAHEAELKFALIHGTLGYEKFDDVDLVVEAAVERMPVKKKHTSRSRRSFARACGVCNKHFVAFSDGACPGG